MPRPASPASRRRRPLPPPRPPPSPRCALRLALRAGQNSRFPLGFRRAGADWLCGGALSAEFQAKRQAVASSRSALPARHSEAPHKEHCRH
jgi:hypothetical protein